MQRQLLLTCGYGREEGRLACRPFFIPDIDCAIRVDMRKTGESKNKMRLFQSHGSRPCIAPSSSKIAFAQTAVKMIGNTEFTIGAAAHMIG
jgi:hypothetical protein